MYIGTALKDVGSDEHPSSTGLEDWVNVKYVRKSSCMYVVGPTLKGHWIR